MRDTSKKILLVLSIVGMVVAGAGAASADYTAPPSVDTSTSDDTSTTSEVTPGATLGDGNTYNESSADNHTVQYIAATNQTELYLTRNNSTVRFYQDSNPTTAFWNSTQNDGHFNSTFTEAATVDMEHSPGQNVTVDVTMVNNSSNATIVDGVEQFYVEWDNATGTEVVESSEVGDTGIAQATNASGFAAIDKDFSKVEMTDVETPNDTFYVVASNTSVADDFGAAIDSSDSKLSSVLSLRGAAAMAKIETSDGTTYVPIYTEGNVPSDVDGTYAVAKSVSGTDGFAFHLSSDLSDRKNMDVTVVSGNSLGFQTFNWAAGYLTQGVSNAVGM